MLQLEQGLELSEALLEGGELLVTGRGWVVTPSIPTRRQPIPISHLPSHSNLAQPLLIMSPTNLLLLPQLPQLLLLHLQHLLQHPVLVDLGL